MPILQSDRLTKQYGTLTALNGFDLTVEAGQVFGLLGPNGSGKTTFLALILDVLQPTSGQFTWFEGKGGTHPRRRIGALLETPNFYPYLNAAENLEIIATIKQLPQPPIDRLLEMVNLLDRRHLPFQSYSLGMKQRLALAACLVGDPEVLVLDEPTNGLDPQGIIEVRQLIQKIAATGKTILLASHLLDEVEKICSHVAIIKSGRLLATGAVGSILKNEPTVEVGCAEGELEALRALLSRDPSVRKIQPIGRLFSLELSPGRSAAELNRQAFDQGITLTHLVTKQRSLELEFLEITRS